MRIGIVIPNYNGARFLRECITSVLREKDSDTHVVVMDGGSTDSSLDILRSFGDSIQWISKRDAGQADAIGKGFENLDADLVGWLNSDDLLNTGALDEIRRLARSEPSAALFHGDGEIIDERGRLLKIVLSREATAEGLLTGKSRVFQPGSFYRKSAVDLVGGIDPTWHLLLDLDLWLRLARRFPTAQSNMPLAQFRIHGNAKSSAFPLRFYRELWKINRMYGRNHPAALGSTILKCCSHLAAHLLGLSLNTKKTKTISTPVNVWMTPECEKQYGVLNKSPHVNVTKDRRQSEMQLLTVADIGLFRAKKDVGFRSEVLVDIGHATEGAIEKLAVARAFASCCLIVSNRRTQWTDRRWPSARVLPIVSPSVLASKIVKECGIVV